MSSPSLNRQLPHQRDIDLLSASGNFAQFRKNGTYASFLSLKTLTESRNLCDPLNPQRVNLKITHFITLRFRLQPEPCSLADSKTFSQTVSRRGLSGDSQSHPVPDVCWRTGFKDHSLAIRSAQCPARYHDNRREAEITSVTTSIVISASELSLVHQKYSFHEVREECIDCPAADETGNRGPSTFATTDMSSSPRRKRERVRMVFFSPAAFCGRFPAARDQVC